MNKHTVFVAGKRFVLLSEESNDYVAEIAKEVNETIKQISDENPTMESRSCAILCALDYADDKQKEIKRSKSLSDNAKTVMLQADKHAKQIKELKEKLQKKDSEIEKLKKEIATLKATKEENKTTAPQPQQAKKESRHNHPHVNPYKQQAEEKAKEVENKKIEEKQENQTKGYKPQRQISLFDNEKN
jgi:cell division protein ZapA